MVTKRWNANFLRCKPEILTSSMCTCTSHATSPHGPLGNLVFRLIETRGTFQTLKETKFKILFVQERSDHKMKTTISNSRLCKLTGSLGNLNLLQESMYTVILVRPHTKRELTRIDFFKYQERSVNTWIPNSPSICPVKPFCRAISNDTEPMAACIRGKQINSSINSHDHTDKDVSATNKD